MSEFDECVKVFVKGHCFMRSISYPYVWDGLGGLYLMQDGPGKRRVPRKAEIVVHGTSPQAAAEFARARKLGRHFVSHMLKLGQSSAETRSAYKALRYRSLGAEEFFVHDMRCVPTFAADPEPRRVASLAESEMIRAQRRNKKPMRDEDIGADSPGHRLYAVLTDEAIGWVGSVVLGDDSWVADLFVREAFRCNGYGAALMSHMLTAEKSLGIKRSVLLASTAGARLYPKLGYKHIGTLELFCPMRST